MSCPIQVQYGTTVRRVLYWQAANLIYVPVTAIATRAPLQLTVTDHGMPDRWPVALAGFPKSANINANHSPPEAEEMWMAKAVDDDTIEINLLNANGWNALQDGATIIYREPVSVDGYVGVVEFTSHEGSDDILLSVSSEPGLVFDDAYKTVTWSITPEQLAELPASCRFRLLATSPDDYVTQIDSGEINISEA